PMDTLRTAITTQRSDLLEVVPGIGRKTAQRILFDLHDKADLAAAIHLRESVSDVEQEVIDALKALGYRVNEILPALKRSKAAEAETTEERIRLALREMIQ
ncbi:MAG: Holliday junction branch migration protein RuvA, partial [Chloroflexota bacterium]